MQMSLRIDAALLKTMSSWSQKRLRSTDAVASTVPWTVQRSPIKPFPLSDRKPVPPHISKPPYATTGIVPFNQYADRILLHDAESVTRMRAAAQLARRMLDLACSLAKPGVTTDDIDTTVHEAIIENGAYPSPLNYAGFKKSLCSSINEVVCHGIPDQRPLQFGDIASFDVSCFLGGVHGDNCATVIVGDEQEQNEAGVDWRGVPFRTQFENEDDAAHFEKARRLVQATHESLYAGMEVCKHGGCLSHVGAAIQKVADSYGFASVKKYRGHGISDEFHCPPFVKHYRNNDKLELREGMIFTIEPMLCENSQEVYEWPEDGWTVVTADGGLSAQFEHTILVTHGGYEILTLPG